MTATVWRATSEDRRVCTRELGTILCSWRQGLCLG